MGRRALYHSEAERLEARRTRTRHHVRAYRHRKKLAEQQSLALITGSTRRDSLRTSDHDATNSYHITSPLPHLNTQLAFSHFFGGREFTEHRTSFVGYVKSLRGRVPGGFDLAELASAACAAQYWGREMKNQEMIRTSHELHDEALHGLRQHLLSPGKNLNHGLLLCLLNNAAMLTELMENAAQLDAKPTWLVLYKAGMQLMRKAGPAAFANSWGLAYLEHNRPCVQLLSLLHRDDLFFDDDTWRTIPYHGTLKMPVNHLYDIGDRVIGAIRRARQMNSQPADGVNTVTGQAPSFTIDLLARMLDVNQTLDCWLVDMEYQICNTLYSTKQAELWPDIQLDALAAPYNFSSLAIAAIWNIFWFYKVLLLRTILRHASRLRSANLPTTDKLAISIELEQCALHLCRSQEYITLNYSAAAELSLGWHSCFMLRLVASCFAEGERKDKHELMRWCAMAEDYKEKKSFLGRRDWYVMASVMQYAEVGEL